MKLNFIGMLTFKQNITMATYICLTLSANVPSLCVRPFTGFSVGIVTMIPVYFPTLNPDVCFLKGFYKCTTLRSVAVRFISLV